MRIQGRSCPAKPEVPGWTARSRFSASVVVADLTARHPSSSKGARATRSIASVRPSFRERTTAKQNPVSCPRLTEHSSVLLSTPACTRIAFAHMRISPSGVRFCLCGLVLHDPFVLLMLLPCCFCSRYMISSIDPCPTPGWSVAWPCRPGMRRGLATLQLLF